MQQLTIRLCFCGGHSECGQGTLKTIREKKGVVEQCLINYELKISNFDLFKRWSTKESEKGG